MFNHIAHLCKYNHGNVDTDKLRKRVFLLFESGGAYEDAYDDFFAFAFDEGTAREMMTEKIKKLENQYNNGKGYRLTEDIDQLAIYEVKYNECESTDVVSWLLTENNGKYIFEEER